MSLIQAWFKLLLSDGTHIPIIVLSLSYVNQASIYSPLIQRCLVWNWEQTAVSWRYRFVCVILARFDLWLSPVHTNLEQIWKRRFYSENASNIFHPHHVREQQSSVILDLCLRKTRVAKSNGCRSVFVKFCFRDWLVLTVGQPEQRKLRFQLYSAECGSCPSESTFFVLHTAEIISHAKVAQLPNSKQLSLLLAHKVNWHCIAHFFIMHINSCIDEKNRM